MSYVIYNKETTKLFTVRARSAGMWKDRWESKGAATRAFNSAVKDEKIREDEYAIAESSDFFSNIEKTEIRKGIVHAAGKEFEVGVNTPWTSGPWSETYWCS